MLSKRRSAHGRGMRGRRAEQVCQKIKGGSRQGQYAIARAHSKPGAAKPYLSGRGNKTVGVDITCQLISFGEGAKKQRGTLSTVGSERVSRHRLSAMPRPSSTNTTRANFCLLY